MTDNTNATDHCVALDAPACDRNCDPHAPGVRSGGASHFLDCPVWTYLGVTTARPTPPGTKSERDA